MPIKVEAYEAYYKKQKADSNCGFAEEFEVKHKIMLKEPIFFYTAPECGINIRIMPSVFCSKRKNTPCFVAFVITEMIKQ